MNAKKRELLLDERKNGYDRLTGQELEELERYCEDYKRFLDVGRTERECVTLITAEAEKRGYHPLQRGETLHPGDKVYRTVGNKSILLAVVGSEPLEKGAVIGGAHIDSPRLDLKPNPLYEEQGVARFKTHYYGGIRKYQWVSIPLALHGVVCKKDGTTVTVRIGDEPGDPQLTIPDLLPHLANRQRQEPLEKAIQGEDLNIIVGSRPCEGEETEKDRIKLMVLELLYEKYGITEADFNSAELCALPAFRPTDVGLDRSMIGGYGQDDRVCAYAALRGLFDAEQTLKRTCICLLTDKEEIGSYGITGVDSAYFDIFLSDLCAALGAEEKTCIEHSFCCSADVTAAYDANYAYAFDTHNAGRLGGGVSLCKYTGSRGKSGASDATAELVAYGRKILDEDGVLWHICELGKVDEGGGGTIAHYMARRGIPTLDAGTPLMAMHAPFELSSKLDAYMTYRALRAFYNH